MKKWLVYAEATWRLIVESEKFVSFMEGVKVVWLQLWKLIQLVLLLSLLAVVYVLGCWIHDQGARAMFAVTLIVMVTMALGVLRIYNAIVANTASNYRLMSGMKSFTTEASRVAKELSRTANRMKNRVKQDS